MVRPLDPDSSMTWNIVDFFRLACVCPGLFRYVIYIKPSKTACSSGMDEKQTIYESGVASDWMIEGSFFTPKATGIKPCPNILLISVLTEVPTDLEWNSMLWWDALRMGHWKHWVSDLQFHFSLRVSSFVYHKVDDVITKCYFVEVKLFNSLFQTTLVYDSPTNILKGRDHYASI